MFLEKISNFFVKNRKKIFFYSLFAVFIFIALHDVSFAVNEGGSQVTQSSATETDKWVKIWNWIIASLTTLLGILTYFVTLLLDPDFVSWKLFEINTKLHDLWILVSNIVYFIFAFILIWIAFMNIIWKWDKWELKQALPKFIIWVLIVPFSWFFVSLIVSLANILTFAALSLPSNTFPDYNQSLNKIYIPEVCTINLEQWDWKASNNNKQESSSVKEWINCENPSGWSWYTLSELTLDSSFWLISSYTYWLLKVDKLDSVDWWAIVNGLKTVEDLIVYLLFSWVFILAYSILIIALAIVLVVRVIWLWIYMALSPLFWLAYFFWKDSNSEIFKKINITEFIALAMVPVYTTLALSFWFLFLSLTMNWISGELDEKAKSKGDIINNDKFIINWSWITIKFNNGEKEVKLNVKWWWAFAQIYSSTSKFAWSFTKSQLWVIGTIFVNVFLSCYILGSYYGSFTS